MQRLGAPQYGGQGLHGDAHDVVVRLLGGQGAAGGLGVEAQHLGFGVFGAEALFHDFGPDPAGGAEFGDFFEEVVVGVEEEGQARGEVVHFQAGFEGGFDVGDAVGQGEGDFLDGAGSGFADVVAGDGDGVPFGYVVFAVGEDVGDDPHGFLGGVDVGAAGHVFLEDVVLDRAGDFVGRDALFFCYGDVHAEQDGGGGVDGHGGGDFVERDAVEEDFHVGQRVDGNADFADFALAHGGVRVVPHLGREVKGDREAGLAGREQVFVAFVGFLGGAEAGVLAHGPEAAPVHGRLDAAGVGVFAGQPQLFFVAGVVKAGGEAALQFDVGRGQEFFHPLR